MTREVIVQDNTVIHKITVKLPATARPAAKPIRIGGSLPNDAETPPLGGCDPDLNFVVTAHYLNGVLVDTETPFFGQVQCDTTAPGQTLRYMGVGSELLLNGSLQKQADYGECSHEAPGQAPCVNVFSTATNLCFVVGVSTCHGNYSGLLDYDLLLPSGWVWSGWDPRYCTTLGGNVELLCTLPTGNAYVSPIL